MARPTIKWENEHALPSRGYTCGYCGVPLASEKGWHGKSINNASIKTNIYVCHHCQRPSFFDYDGSQCPGVVFGNSVQDIPDESIRELYEEARRATGSSCYTCAVLACRKLLMHIAVSRGAPAGQSFVKYVEYLAENHYVPPDAKDWVDHIRKRSNEANHDIIIMTENDAKELLSFIEMLLKIIFEFPAIAKRKST